MSDEGDSMRMRDIAHLPIQVQEAINWALAKGVARRVAPNTFAPDDFVTRAELALYLRRAVDGPMRGIAFLPFAVDPGCRECDGSRFMVEWIGSQRNLSDVPCATCSGVSP